jgi:hypothetical protein
MRAFFPRPQLLPISLPDGCPTCGEPSGADSTRIAPMSETPEQSVQRTSPQKKQGIFKLFLGYAPGVGKTYSMLAEAIRRKSRG